MHGRTNVLHHNYIYLLCTGQAQLQIYSLASVLNRPVPFIEAKRNTVQIVSIYGKIVSSM
uniref:Uncharacterized protein n=1 Tax=Anguilla anguilla TaxID=7936 RepID=A0A0E9SIW6_ANGAN